MNDSHWLAWAAGIIDGEGCISLKRIPQGLPALSVSAYNTDPRMAAKLQAMFGGRRLRREKPVGCRPIYQWTVTTKHAEAVLLAVLPWLVLKRDQAEVALAARRFVRKPGGKKKIPMETAESVEWLRVRLSELKVTNYDEAPCEKPQGIPHQEVVNSQGYLFPHAGREDL